MESGNPESFLPLASLTFGILTAVAQTSKSGYGIVREIEEGSEGRSSPGTGRVYVALQRLIQQGLEEPASELKTTPTPSGVRICRKPWAACSVTRPMAPGRVENPALHLGAPRWVKPLA